MTKGDISLLPREGLGRTLLERLINWLFSIGKHIVVFTELIVIGAFLSRFWLDRKNSDLSEEIRQERAILEATRDFEKEFRFFQARLNAAAKALESGSSPLLPLDIVSQSLAQDMVILEYDFTAGDKNKASIVALVFSEKGLAEFVGALLGQEVVDKVKVGTIEKQEGYNGMKIQFVIKFKNLDSK